LFSFTAGFFKPPTGALVVVVEGFFSIYFGGALFVAVVLVVTVVTVGAVSRLLRGEPSNNLTALGLANIP
jgi:hypothetical protein